MVTELLVSAVLAIPDNVPPKVKEPVVETVPVKVIPLTVPVPDTEVTVPPPPPVTAAQANAVPVHCR